MKTEANNYRPDIDGLRAVAVSAVLLFHAGVPGFTGGYIGVDVFFVISGFLITSILWRECEVGKFSLVDFYERRIRRIMPALLATLVLTMIGGYFFLGVDDYASQAKTVIATLVFASNIKFWRGSGYFEGASEMQPLLHTWSLAIEEQFYLFWPILLFVIHRYGRRWLGAAVWTVTIASLMLSAVAVYLSPSATFYLLPTRAWELALGALVALNLFPGLRRWSGTAAWIGLFLILVPIFAYDQYTLFPGLAALPSCLGTALLIQAGKEQRGTAGRLLSARPFVLVGLISYSLYLVHFPVLVYLRHWHLGELPLGAGLAGLGLSVLLAILSYRFIEQPFRNRATVSARGVWSFAIAGNFCVAALAVGIWALGGFPDRFSAERRAFAQAQSDFDGPSRDCIAGSYTKLNTRPECQLSNAGATAAIVWGDSHAAALSPALREPLSQKSYNARLLVFNSCPPLITMSNNRVLSWADRKKCRDRNTQFIEEMRSRADPALILISGYWSTYAKLMGGKVSPEFEGDLIKNLDALSRHHVYIVMDTPRASYSLPWSLAYGRLAPTIDASTEDAISLALRRAAEGRATILDPSTIICSRQPCAPLMNGRPILSDGNHLAASVAREKLGPYFRTVLPDARSTEK